MCQTDEKQAHTNPKETTNADAQKRLKQCSMVAAAVAAVASMAAVSTH